MIPGSSRGALPAAEEPANGAPVVVRGLVVYCPDEDAGPWARVSLDEDLLVVVVGVREPRSVAVPVTEKGPGGPSIVRASAIVIRGDCPNWAPSKDPRLRASEPPP